MPPGCVPRASWVCPPCPPLPLLGHVGSSMQALLSSCVQHVLEELLSVGVLVFTSREKRSGGASTPGLPFPYQCVLELWWMVVRVCDRMAEEGTGKVKSSSRGRQGTGGLIVGCSVH